ncbi:nucleotidyltransferase family protein [Selenomonas sp. AE3005]|uniref:nucleotidyltransferase family protein n=1 Tax=Selenomonas sp. AE3005 TaxID=1485543 RepID=UPI000480D028|nr:nucleotidyltransferase family protein [Selenomonas sp. AE3005]
MKNLLTKEAIVLAGGFGTRLRQVVSDVPKPMASIDAKGTPFLTLVLKQLVKQGVEKVILSVGYMAEVIQQFFGNSYAGMTLLYSVEDEPLGTGGAVKKAMTLCTGDLVFVLNGDTYFDVDFVEIERQHRKTGADFTLAAREMSDFDRYGALVMTEDDKVIAFLEKKYCDHGFINGGIYCMERTLLSDMDKKTFSLEKDFLENRIDFLHIVAYKSNGYFIDIGIPDDYQRARKYFGREN